MNRHAHHVAGSSSARPTGQHESPLSRVAREQQPAPLPTPDLPDDEDDSVMEITADEAAGSSGPMQFGNDVKLWTETCASRPEPRPAKAKKRKSNEISMSWDSDDADLEDEFPDLQELLSTPAAPKSSANSNPGVNGARSGLRRATTVEPRESSTQSRGPKSPSPTRRNRTPSPGKPPKSPTRAQNQPVMQQPVRTPAGSPRKLPPVTLQPNALSPGTIQRALTQTPKPAKTRRSSVIEETDEEFVTPSTGGGPPKASVLKSPITAIPCTFEASMTKSEPDPEPELEPEPAWDSSVSMSAKPRAKVKAESSSAATPSRKRVSPRKVKNSSSPPTDLQGLEDLVEEPWPLQCRLDRLREELDQNVKAFQKALGEGRPREERERFREERNRLSGEQQLLNGLLDRTRAYDQLKKDVDALTGQIAQAYMASLPTDDDEDKLDQIQAELKERKQAFAEALSEAASQHPQSIEQLKTIPPPPTSRIPQTQLPPSRPRQNPQASNMPEDFSSQVIHQTQFPEEPRPERYVPRDEPPPIDPDDLEGMFSDIDDSPVQRRPPPPKQTRPQPRYPEPSRNVEHDYFSDDIDPDMLALADSFTGPDPSAPTNSSRRSPLVETSGNAKPPSRRKGPEKRVASTAARNSFPAEQMKFPWSPEVKQMLKDRFRMEHFRHNQLEAINATLSGKDAFILMPTGGGKSLCYQLPAVVKSGSTRGVTIVVSPLISLMQDQVDHLKALNIHAVAFNGEAPKEYKDMVMGMFKEANPENFIELLYVTPEMVIKNKRFQDAMGHLHRKKKLARIVIDEAHCVSQWGHDFRPDYKQLGDVRGQLGGVPLMALTATATNNVIMDVMHNLGMVDSQVFTQSFNRANLYYEVRPKTSSPKAIEGIADLIKEKYADQCGIVYTISRKSAEDVAEKLRGHGIKAAHYHASIEAAAKAETQRKWQTDRIRVVVATIAFGMGIDKADVRFVIHHGIPKSLEGYYQETGRAGRDGKPSDCYLYYSLADVRILRKLIHSGEGSWEQKQRQTGMLNRMVSFCDNPADCRRVEVLSYFGEDFDKADCNKTCDNCRNGAVSEQRDYTEVAKSIIEAVTEEPQLTAGQCADLLMGKRPPASEFGDSGAEYYGVASDMKKYELERVINKLDMDGILAEDNKMNHRAGFAVQYLKVRFAAPEGTTSRMLTRTCSWAPK